MILKLVFLAWFITPVCDHADNGCINPWYNPNAEGCPVQLIEYNLACV